MTILPNLSTWHRAPVGATIPAGVPYAYTFAGGCTAVLDGYSKDITVRDNPYNTYYTEHPVTPPLPTEEGAAIAVSYNEQPPHILLTRKAGHWVNRYGTRWNVDQIRAWAPVTIGEVVVMP